MTRAFHESPMNRFASAVALARAVAAPGISRATRASWVVRGHSRFGEIPTCPTASVVLLVRSFIAVRCPWRGGWRRSHKTATCDRSQELARWMPKATI